MTDALLPTRFLFRFSFPCRYAASLGTTKTLELDDAHRLPNTAELEGRAAWAELRAAWSEKGVAFVFEVRGKQQPAWCRSSKPEDSDSVQFWIDTRDVHNVHRASRFCHHFLFLPFGDGPKGDQPIFFWLPIHRAKENPREAPAGSIKLRSEKREDGYRFEIFLAAHALTGFDPAEHPRLGFAYAVKDRELGELTLTAGSPMPYEEDPSLWATLELVRT